MFSKKEQLKLEKEVETLKIKLKEVKENDV